jgi:hypothetical protein
MIFHSLISFFYKFIGSDYPITVEIIENFDAIQYFFFTNFLAYKSLYTIQIALRFTFKMEYLYTEFLLPVDLLYLKQEADDFEEAKQAKLDDEIAKTSSNRK